jgi:hypothetical protein
MKKHAQKKLSLNRETLRHLQGELMRDVAGGSLANSECCTGSEMCTSTVCIAPSVCECASRGCVGTQTCDFTCQGC